MSAAADGPRLFRFAQLEFPWALGPADGRYVLREAGGAEPSHILVLATLGAPERRVLGRRRTRRAEPEPPPAAVPTSRVTVIDAAPLAADADAAAWLAEAHGDRAREEIDATLSTVNRVLQAHRAATADPSARDVSAGQALVARLGYGSGEQVAEGRWRDAVEVPLGPGRRSRVSALRPQERLAALLGGRERALACEELTMRARLDLQQGRAREAALQLRVALEAALAELDGSDTAGMAERLDQLRGRREAVGEAANAALRGGLDERQERAVEESVERIEAALRARTAALP